MFFIEVLPPQSAEFPSAQAGGQFRVKEVVPNCISLDGFHEGIQLLICQHLFWLAGKLGCSHLLRWIGGDESGLYRRIQNTMEGGVDAADGTACQLTADLCVEFSDVCRFEQ